MKPETGFLEVDIPILTHEHYNSDNGLRYRKVLEENGNIHGRTTYGLAGGFSAGHAGSMSRTAEVRDIPLHSESDASSEGLSTQTLGGKVHAKTVRDPVYMIGTFRDNRIHLSHVDALVQARPQLHHVDAEDELNQGRTTAALSKMKSDMGPPKLETRAVELKLKDNKDEGKDRSLNANARLLRNIQHEPWKVYAWTDQDDPESCTKFTEIMYMHQDVANKAKQLKSVISNSEWLDKMSVPREAGHGKKGLLAKLRGRERERLRRKKNEEQKKRDVQNSTGILEAHTITAGFLDDGSENSELSEQSSFGSDAGNVPTDADMVDLVDDGDVEIKEEPSTVTDASAAAPAPASSLGIGGLVSARSGARKRGRPPRGAKANNSVVIDD